MACPLGGLRSGALRGATVSRPEAGILRAARTLHAGRVAYEKTASNGGRSKGQPAEARRGKDEALV